MLDSIHDSSSIDEKTSEFGEPKNNKTLDKFSNVFSYL